MQLWSGRASVRPCVGTCLHFSEILLPGASLPPFGWEELIPPSVWAEAVSERAHCPWPVSVFRQICFLSSLIGLLPALSCLIPSNLTSLLFFPLLALCLWPLLGKMNFVETDWGKTAESESQVDCMEDQCPQPPCVQGALTVCVRNAWKEIHYEWNCEWFSLPLFFLTIFSNFSTMSCILCFTNFFAFFL